MRAWKRDRPRGAIIFVHSSDEHYGADRIVLDIVDALTPEELDRAQFWLPTDVEHGPRPLCLNLESRGAIVRHVDLPVLRRSYRTPLDLVRLAHRALRLRRRLRQLRPELVYCTTSAMFLAAPLARAAGVPRVVGHVQEIWSRSDRAALGLMTRACDRILAISGPVREELPRRPRSRAVLVLNATPAPDRVVLLREHTGPLRFLVASRWNGWKGHRTLLDAWDRLDAPGHLVVLGGPPKSGVSFDVSAHVQWLRFPESVEIVGEVPDVATWIERADVVVMPSDKPEPFGLVAIEAFARGRPVLASDGGGLGDIVTHGADGWLFPPGDAVALAQVLGNLTRAEVSLAGDQARAAYEARFTSSRYALEWRRAVGLV